MIVNPDNDRERKTRRRIYDYGNEKRKKKNLDK